MDLSGIGEEQLGVTIHYHGQADVLGMVGSYGGYPAHESGVKGYTWEKSRCGIPFAREDYILWVQSYTSAEGNKPIMIAASSVMDNLG
jgi:hypothetical protein